MNDMKKNNLNLTPEERRVKHEKNKKRLKIIGIIVMICAAGFTITGFVDFAASFGSGDPPTLFWCLIVGFPMIGVGGMLLSLGFRRELTGYVKNESVPVINEAGEEIAPAVSAIARAAKSESGENLCPHCGKPNDDGAKFCRHCGKELLVTCPACGEKVKHGEFCDKCGAKLD